MAKKYLDMAGVQEVVAQTRTYVGGEIQDAVETASEILESKINQKQNKDVAVTRSTSTSAVGSTIQPVYVNSSGVATATSYTLEKSVTAGSKLTDTTYSLSAGTTNGYVVLTPSSGSAQPVKVKGLKSAAYTDSTEYATSAQGTLADNAVPQSAQIAGVTINTGITADALSTGLGLGSLAKSSTVSNKAATITPGSGTATTIATIGSTDVTVKVSQPTIVTSLVTAGSTTNQGNKVLIASGTTANTVVWSSTALGSAAYTNSSAYATSAQGTLADNAVPQSAQIAGVTISTGITTTALQTALGLGTAAYKNTTSSVSSSTSTFIPTEAAVYAYVNDKIAAADAMIYKGTIGSSGATISSLPNTTAKTGWTYKVVTAGTYAGVACEVGDMIICLTDGSSGTNATWTVVQTNIDGAVVNSSIVTTNNFASFVSKGEIKDSGYSFSSFATAAQGTLADNAVPKSAQIAGVTINTGITADALSTGLGLGSLAKSSTVSNKAATITPGSGTATTIATIGSTDVTVKVSQPTIVTSLVTAGSTTNQGNKVLIASGTTANTVVWSSTALGSAAYTNSSAYATSAQGTLADNAVPQSAQIAGVTINSGIGTTALQNALGLKNLAYSSTVTDKAATVTPGSTTATTIATVGSTNITVKVSQPTIVTSLVDAGSATDQGNKVLIASSTTANTVVWSTSTLGSAAFTDSGAYATAAQGTLADNAVPKSAKIAGVTINSGISAADLKTGLGLGNLAYSSTVTDKAATITPGSETATTIAKVGSTNITVKVSQPTIVTSLVTAGSTTNQGNKVLIASGTTANTVVWSSTALGSAAFTNSSAYATSAQGTLADNAVPQSAQIAGVTINTGITADALSTGLGLGSLAKSSTVNNKAATITPGSGTATTIATIGSTDVTVKVSQPTIVTSLVTAGSTTNQGNKVLIASGTTANTVVWSSTALGTAAFTNSSAYATSAQGTLADNAVPQSAQIAGVTISTGITADALSTGLGLGSLAKSSTVSNKAATITPGSGTATTIATIGSTDVTVKVSQPTIVTSLVTAGSTTNQGNKVLIASGTTANTVVWSSTALGSAAYTNSSAYATSAQGTLADNAVPQSAQIAGVTISTGITASALKTALGLGNLAYSSTVSNKGATLTPGSTTATTIATIGSTNVTVKVSQATILTSLVDAGSATDQGNKVLIASGTTADTLVWSSTALGSAAFTDSGTYATAAQGTLADNAVPKSAKIAGVTINSGISAADLKTGLGLGNLAYSSTVTDKAATITPGSETATTIAKVGSTNITVKVSQPTIVTSLVTAGSTTNQGNKVLIASSTTANTVVWSTSTLGSAAYTNSSAYATAAQGTLADNAVPQSAQIAGVTISTGIGTTALQTALGLGTAAYKNTTSSISSSTSTSIPTEAAVYAYINDKIAAADAMIYKGTIGSSGATVSSLPNTTAKTGWTYKVVTAGTYAGVTCEIGDMIICLTDGSSTTAATWTVVQANIDGAVTNASTVTANHLASFVSKSEIKDSGYVVSDFATAAQGTLADNAVPKSAQIAGVTINSGISTSALKSALSLGNLAYSSTVTDKAATITPGSGTATTIATIGSTDVTVKISQPTIVTSLITAGSTTDQGNKVLIASGTTANTVVWSSTALGTAAFTNSSAYATSAQGTLADNAVPQSAQIAGVTISTGITAAALKTALSLGNLAYSSTVSNKGATITPGSGTATTIAKVGSTNITVKVSQPTIVTSLVDAGSATDQGNKVLIASSTTANTVVWSTSALGSAAFTDSSAYATAAQGTLADNAVPKSAKIAGVTISTGISAADLKTGLGLGNLAYSSTVTDKAATIAPGSGTATTIATIGSTNVTVKVSQPTIVTSLVTAGSTTNQGNKVLIASSTTANTVVWSTSALGSAAYTNSSAYATAAQGTLADSAVQHTEYATTAVAGLVSTTTQSFAGAKTFTDDVIIGNTKFHYSTSGTDNILTISFL